jgi:hypothetical protein
MHIVGKLDKSQNDRIAILEKRIKWLEITLAEIIIVLLI